MGIAAKVRVLLTTLIVLTASGISQESLEMARKSFEDGSSAFTARHWAAAESALKESYAQRAFPITAYFLSCTYVQMGNKRDAGRYAQFALSGTPALKKEYSAGAHRIIDWSKPSPGPLDIETQAHLDSASPNIPLPTETTLPTPPTMVMAGPPQAEVLIRGSSPAIFLVVDGRRRWIPNEATFNALGLDWNAIQTISDSILDNIPQGTDYPSLSRRLVKGSAPATFFLERGRRRWIPDEQTFNARGFSWSDVEAIPDKNLESIPLGPDLSR
jgi:hypothetical protein